MATSLSELDLKKLLIFKPAFWDKLAQYVIKWIYKDMLKGKVQAYLTMGAYRYSTAYAKLKANWMKRRTKGGELKSFDPSQDFMGNRLYGKRKKIKLKKGRYNYRDRVEAYFGYGKKKVLKGQNLTAYQGQSIRSNWTQSVNMLLTGQTIDGLHKESSDATSLTMSYAEKDRWKIIGNQRLGRYITTLNNEHRIQTENLIKAELRENLRDLFRGVITINIGRA